MSRSASIVGGALFALGASIFLWKILVLEVPVLPRQAENLWRVEIEAHVRGDGRGSVRVQLPISDGRQILHDEHVTSDGLAFGIRTRGEARVGVWRGRLDRQRMLSYGFRVQLRPASTLRETVEPATPGAEEGPAADLPVDTTEVVDALKRLDLDPADAPATTRELFSFVTDEIELVEGGPDDVLLALASREGSPLGKVRLLATLLRASDIPARLGIGLRLSKPRAEREVRWAEAWNAAEGWVALFPSQGFMGELPVDLLTLCHDCSEVAQASGAEALSIRYRVTKERFDTDELAALMVPASPGFAWASLYRLPLRTQASLHLLLLIPVALLLVALFRNVIGLPTFGTFMPVLIALSLRDAGLLTGLAMIAAVMLIGIAARLGFDRLHLLFVPRVSIVLCLVILLIVLMALLGYDFQARDLLTGTLFPIVILSMLIERFSVTAAEEGFPRALLLLGNSTLVATCTYPVFRWTEGSHLVFGFPELVLALMGILVWIGGYTGYRISELIRFRHLAEEARP